jgi:hypothetical protein
MHPTFDHEILGTKIVNYVIKYSINTNTYSRYLLSPKKVHTSPGACKSTGISTHMVHWINGILQSQKCFFSGTSRHLLVSDIF